MSSDETRPQDATPEAEGSPADAYVSPDPTSPFPEPVTTQDTGPGTGLPETSGQQPYPESGFFASIRRDLFPRSERRWIGGVAGGFAERIGWDPLLVRGLLIVSFFLGGLGLILYGVGWALLPERDGRIQLQEAVRGNLDVAMLGAVVVTITGFAWGGPLGLWDSGASWVSVFFWLAVLGLVFYLIVQGVRRQRKQSPTPPKVPHVPNSDGSAPFTPAPAVDYRRSDGPQLVAPRPVSPRPARVRRGPGGTTVGLALGVILLAGALLLASQRAHIVDRFNIAPAWLGVATVVLGIAILVSSMRGRTSGVLGFLSVIALMFGLVYVTLFNSPQSWIDSIVVTHNSDAQRLLTSEEKQHLDSLDGGTVTVRNVQDAEDGFSINQGDTTIDLSELDLSTVQPGDAIQIPIAVGEAAAHVIVPKDAPVWADTFVKTGVVQWNLDGREATTIGIGSYDYFSSDEVNEDGAVISLQIEVDAGGVTVSERS